MAKIPILSYHSVAEASQGAQTPGLNVPTRDFERQMWSVKRFGYRCVSISEGFDRLRAGDVGGCLVLTFDDGYANNLLNAAPILKKYGFGATCYVVSDCLGAFNYWDAALGSPQRLMSRLELDAWLAHGLEVGSHTRSHPRLDEVEHAQALDEIFSSREALRSLTGTEIEHFGYPYGRFTEQIANLVKQAGYRTAVSTVRGIADQTDNPFYLPRIAISDGPLCKFLVKALTPYSNFHRAREFARRAGGQSVRRGEAYFQDRG